MSAPADAVELTEWAGTGESAAAEEATEAAPTADTADTTDTAEIAAAEEAAETAPPEAATPDIAVAETSETAAAEGSGESGRSSEELTVAIWEALAGSSPETGEVPAGERQTAPDTVDAVAVDGSTGADDPAPAQTAAAAAGDGPPGSDPWFGAAALSSAPTLPTLGASSESQAPGGTAGSVPDASTEEEARYRTTLSWPPPRKPRIAAGFLSLLVMVIMVALLVTNGRVGRSSDKTKVDKEALPALKTDPGAVPAEWIVYRDQSAGFGISYPPTWAVRDVGNGVEIRDPSSKAELRIDQRHPAGKTAPQDDWLQQERDLSTRSPAYHRLQLSAATYQGHLAALWEYTYAEGNVATHAADLEFVTKNDRFILNFRSPATEWQKLLPAFQGFLSSFKVPK